MKALIYDGTFEGLLTSIYEAFYLREIIDGIYTKKEYTPNFLTQVEVITTNYEKYEKVINGISNKISRESLENIYYAYLSELPGISKIIYNYVKQGFRLKSKIDMHLHLPEVSSILKARSKVNWEVQRFVGFARFTLLGDIYYSKIEPDHNITELLAPHFSERLPLEKWVIHDTLRNIAAIHFEGKFILSSFSSDELSLINSPKNIDIYENLWKNYFVSLSIKERENSNCQRNHLPIRYRNNLTEFI